jgi:Flp pilus assembly CpaE family ATPase
MVNISLNNWKQAKALLDELKQIDPDNGKIALLSQMLAGSE